jgi:hypothetical protein
VVGDPRTQGSKGTGFPKCVYIYVNMYITAIPKEKMAGRIAQGYRDKGRPEFSPRDQHQMHALLTCALE